MTYRVSMILTNTPMYPAESQFTHNTRFAGCKDENDARRKCREVYGDRLVGVKTVKLVEE